MSSDQLSAEIEPSFSNLKPLKMFEYPNQASNMIWDVNPDNFLQITSQIVKLIKTNKITVELAFYLVDVFSSIRFKDIKLLADLYQSISIEFSHITIKPRNERLTTLLYYKGMRFEKFEPEMKEEDILNIFPTNSISHYVAWDKIDELKNKFPTINPQYVNQKMFPLDCAIKFGSELCFNYLRNIGAKYTKDSEKFAVQGGNEYIFNQMIEDGKTFDGLINMALKYHNYQIADYLKTEFGQKPNSVAQSMLYGNYGVASYLLSKGSYSNEYYGILFIFTFIITSYNSFSLYKIS
ncbi:hypothetical protein TVAG_405190 [Trichomonas vaginalis G3]|uniref:Uncharacterized protein n=1 Tax=Trichomonas vaginalis (strain ATCC PRA-98 / G3) TaxID=412133 RepID=A2E337_TRIV3|nr:protein ubiquitination [Trichomonas vaginalis G3]EAY12973.1 hypothetical protein TVAG_405190 [Trichomonas vaginalis G3]KAI5499796.1 protein ubiquitination [Trichomonas vaginalis G3]|eukprot:XP_001325196.1 hypothetical protein [Trichomonas vaginalis G3]